ncbi:MAG: right-handed parallel beta-helix repeat-containing protein [Pirellulales bacterium]|nr:right-handed parallel beta-helix repeat-containing protein [Pirellulales bacterium]
MRRPIRGRRSDLARRFELLAITGCLIGTPGLAPAAERKVPADHRTIQEAIDAAADGDEIVVARGVYIEGLVIAGKSVILRSAYAATRDPDDRRLTVIDGGIYGSDELVRRDAAIVVAADAGPATRIEGFTIRNADDGISCHARIAIVGNRFVNNVDAIDYENGGGSCRGNLFIGNQDDAIDVDYATSVEAVGNVIRDSVDDGIEIRLHDYRGPELHVIVRDNVIVGSGEDGIQIIGYPGLSDRRVVIERNLIVQSVAAGIGVMSEGITLEDLRAAAVEEPLTIVNNTIVANRVGIACGGGAVVANNAIVGNREEGIRVGPGILRATCNLCWDNGVDVVGKLSESPLASDPRLDGRYRPSVDGPCVDAGAAAIEDCTLAALETVRGERPDIGREER